MKMETLQDLYMDELRVIFDAENQLVKALPKMAKAASNEEL
jgi:ferritin-like metal-binding protein YciE